MGRRRQHNMWGRGQQHISSLFMCFPATILPLIPQEAPVLINELTLDGKKACCRWPAEHTLLKQCHRPELTVKACLSFLRKNKEFPRSLQYLWCYWKPRCWRFSCDEACLGNAHFYSLHYDFPVWILEWVSICTSPLRAVSALWSAELNY